MKTCPNCTNAVRLSEVCLLEAFLGLCISEGTFSREEAETVLQKVTPLAPEFWNDVGGDLMIRFEDWVRQQLGVAA